MQNMKIPVQLFFCFCISSSTLASISSPHTFLVMKPIIPCQDDLHGFSTSWSPMSIQQRSKPVVSSLGLFVWRGACIGGNIQGDHLFI
ncbi:hypothetical protein QBC39DRAFT_339128, partial [Podospora conica]